MTTERARMLARRLAKGIKSMPSQTAIALAEALNGGAQVKTLAADLMKEIAPETTGVLDIGVGQVLAIRPGYGPLSDPMDYFFVLPEL